LADLIADGLSTRGHPSATGRAWDRESLPVKDWQTFPVPRSQLTLTFTSHE